MCVGRGGSDKYAAIVETLRELLDPDHVSTTSWGVDATEYHGIEGSLAARAELSVTWDAWEQELEEVLDSGDRGVVVLLRFRARGHSSGVPVEFAWALAHTLRNGRVVTSQAFNSHDEALRAVGLQE